MTVPAQTMLDNVETAINNILSGGAAQSYNVSGINLSRYSLKELYDLRAQLKIEVARSETGGTTRLAEFQEPG